MNSKGIFGAILSLHGTAGLVYSIALYNNLEEDAGIARDIFISGVPALLFLIAGIILIKRYSSGEWPFTASSWKSLYQSLKERKRKRSPVGPALVILFLFLSCTCGFGQTVIPKPDSSKIYKTGMDRIKEPDTTALPSQAVPICPKPMDYCTLEKGKLFCVKNAALESVDKSLTLENGTVVSPSGRIRTKEGKTWQLKNGDKIDMKGVKIQPAIKSPGKEEAPKESMK